MRKKNIPNFLTLMRIVLIPIFVFILNLSDSSFSHFFAGGLFILASLTDYLDGYLARRWKTETNFGRFVDPLTDKILVMTAFIMLIDIGLVPAWIVAVVICREFLVTGLRLLLVEKKVEVLAASDMGKIKTFFQMFSVVLLLFHWITLGKIVLYVSLFFTLYSGYFYLKRGYLSLRGYF